MNDKSENNKNAMMILLQKYTLLILVICIGLLISLLGFYKVREWEKNNLLEHFKKNAKNCVSVLTSEIIEDIDVVKNIKGLYAASQSVERNEFHTFVENFLIQKESIKALEWIPHVRDHDRDTFEHSAKLEGFAEFQITDNISEKSMCRAASRPEYFPVYFVEPYKGNEISLGFDLASNPVRLDTLNRSRDTGLTAATPPVTLVQETGSQLGVLVFEPIYHNNSIDSTEKRENLKGFALGVYRIGDILKNALTQVNHSGINVYLYDVSTSSSELFLGAWPLNSHLLTYKQAITLSTLNYIQIINVADRRWAIVCIPTPDLLVTAKTWQPWVVFAACFTFTCLLCSYILLTLTHINKVKQFAAELLIKKEQLESEVAERKKAKQILQESEEHARTLLTSLQTGILVIDAETHIIADVNDAAAKMFGAKREAIIGELCNKYICPAEQGHCPVSDLGQSVHNSERILLKADGKQVPVIKSVSSIIFNGRKHFLENFIDISERKKAEEELMQSSQIQTSLNKLLNLSLKKLSLQEILEHSIDVIMEIPSLTLESKGSIFLVEDQPDVLVMKAQRKLAEPLKTICSRVPFGKCLCGRAALTGQIQFADCIDGRHENRYDGMSPHGHYNVPIKSGEKVLGVINLYTKHGRQRSEKEEAFLCAAADVLAGIIVRKQAENALQQSQYQQKAILDTIPDITWFKDRQSKYIAVNEPFGISCGFKPEDVVGKNDFDLWPKDLAEKYRIDDLEVVTIGKRKQMEEWLQTVKGKRIWLDTVKTPIYDVNGQIIGTSGIARDITTRKEAEQKQKLLMEQLERANKELADFAYITSHDLKAPLRGISTLVEWILTDYSDKLEDTGKEQLNLLATRVNRMHALIEGILQYSRAGTANEEKEQIDLNDLISQIIDTIAPPKNIEIIIEDQLPTICFDQTRITQVFQNLLSNAVKYMDKPDGRITIGCSQDNRFWKFSVADNGPGIEERHFERIFKMFQTLAPKDNFESTGIGLTVVKKIIEKYGGKVWLKSQLDAGTTFFFTLPMLESEVINDAKLQTSSIG